MLTFLKGASGTIVAKILLGLLIASFAVWGVSGAALNFASGSIGSVGSIKISTSDFQREYLAEIDRVGRQFGQRLTSTQARQFGLDRQILSRMVNQATLDDRATALKLGVSDDKVAEEILTDPAFLDANGAFDSYRYQQLVVGSGLSEKAFLQEQKKAYTRQQMVNTLIGDVAIPDALLAAAETHRNEERTVDYIEIDVRDITAIPSPDDETLQAYFDGNKSTYRAPEYRSIDYISVQLSDLGGADGISDAEAREYYSANKERFTKTEKRNIRRINFDTEAKARDAELKLKGGMSFDALMMELELTAADVFLGVLSKNAILDRKLADAAFALEEKKPSGVIEGDFGKMIIIVDDIEGGSTQTFESLVTSIKSDMAAEKDNRVLLEKLDQVEDARAAGSTFSEIAAKYSLKLIKLQDVAQSGELKASGQISSTIPGREQLLSEAFQSDVGIENDVIEVGRDGFLWFEVTDIKAARDRTLEEVKERAREDWITAETTNEIAARADGIVAALNGGQTVAELEEEMGRKVTTVSGIKRNQPVDGLSAAAVGSIFNGAKGYITSAPGERSNQAFVLKVTDIASGSSERNEELTNNITSAVQNDVLATYIGYVREREGSTINAEALEYATDLDAQHGYGGHGGNY